MNITQKEIADATQELYEALLENIEASRVEENAKLAKIKAHKRLVMAREVIYGIRF